MSLYCYLDSSGNIDHTNLQLYSLKKAAECWNDLVDELEKKDEITDLKERIVFIVNCFGLSLSQLLGQNWPSEELERIKNPDFLLKNILKCSFLDKNDIKRLNKGYEEIIDIYDALRHFGKVKNNAKYNLIDELDITKLSHLKKYTIEIWDAIISIQRNYDQNEIEDFDSICESIPFRDIPEQKNEH